MRCKLNDHVIVIAGPAAGASGTIVAATPPWAKDLLGEDWIVEFPEPVPCYHVDKRVTDTRVGHPDQDLLPVNPPAEQIDTTSDIEVAA